MKIEIELYEIENLRNEVATLREENSKLCEELKQISKTEMEQKAISLSRFLFEQYMEATFKELGMKPDRYSSVDFGNVSSYLGKSWYNSEKLNVILNVNITNEFKNAFLRFGVKAEDRSERIVEENLLDKV